jgi:Phasin protein
MPEFNVDPSTALDTYRSVFAPTLHAQMEGLKAIERFGRYQYSVAGDYLEWGVAQARANLTLGTPAEHFASQTTLSTQFGEKLQGRVREFMNLASETRASFNQLLGEATARLAETIKQSP